MISSIRQRLQHLPMALLALLIPSAAFAQLQLASSQDKTLSPYFVVISKDGATDALPLKDTRAEVNIAGVIAHVRVTQTYKNEGKNPLEAIYIFPGSTRSAVFGMKMTIGDRIIIAQIQKKEDARAMYEKAKQEGKSASLLEQNRPNVFQMNVANIMPGDTIQVALDYTELLVPDEGVYEFVYPTVVGPRYSNLTESTAGPTDSHASAGYTREGQKPLYSWGLKARIAAGVPVHEVTSPTHKLSTTFQNVSTVDIATEREEQGGNRDFILRYRLTGDQIQTGLLLYPGEKENFFLAMMQPPRRASAAVRPAREYVFIVDVSGSMHGFPLNTAKQVMRELLGNLRADDTFNVMLFSGGNTMLFERSMAADKSNIEQAMTIIDRQHGGGSTEIVPALRRALALPHDDRASRIFVAVTDGYVMVERECFTLIRENLGNANFFAFGIGSSVNRHLIEGMSRAGMGEAFIITDPKEAPAQARKFREYVESPVLANINLKFEGFDAYDLEPASTPDLFAQRPVIVFGKYRGEAKGRIVLTGVNAAGPVRQELDVSSARPDPANTALRYLWARHRITGMNDHAVLGDALRFKDEVTRLGLEYSLMTEYTSFIAVDSVVRNKDGRQETVKQPLPLPEGVSDRAVEGGTRGKNIHAMPMSPPPASSGVMGFGGMGIGGGGVGYGRAMARPATRELKASPSASPKPADARETGAALQEALPSRDEADRKDKDAGGKEESRPAPAKKADVMTIVSAGSLDRAAAERIARQVFARLRHCMEAARGNNPALTAGQWTAMLKINADGSVAEVTLEGPHAGDAALTGCMKGHLSRMKFPAPANGQPTEAKLGFRL
ncbi:MAG: hypothetical protein GMKNLPBB_00763 [Myxococcota bacterium]|nr:hypothetical protein [Myxococcota bacterium]